MGLNVLKWAYELGVKHERTRIARLLEQTHRQQVDFVDVAQGVLSDTDSNLTKARKERLKKRAELADALSGIISSITQEDAEYISKGSALWPVEEDK